MTVQTVYGRDATGQNSHLIPSGTQAAGYDTGIGSVIPWTKADYAQHMLPYPPIHIDQDANASDYTSDILDVEAGAASPGEIVTWITAARQAFGKALRPGQRWPGIYCSLSNLSSCVGLLTKANITNVPFWLAWQNTEAKATTYVASAAGSYPAIGVQFDYSNPDWDGDIFSVPWLTRISTVPLDPPKTGAQANWAWCHKCKGMFYAPQQSTSVCPAGGHHDGSESYDYSVNYISTPPATH